MSEMIKDGQVPSEHGFVYLHIKNILKNKLHFVECHFFSMLSRG